MRTSRSRSRRAARTPKTPQRLGHGDGFGIGKASAWSSTSHSQHNGATSPLPVPEWPTARNPYSYQPHELAVARAGKLKTVFWFLFVLTTLAYAANRQTVTQSLRLPQASVYRTAVAAFAFAVMLSCFLLEVFWMPMPRDPDSPGATSKDVTKWAIMRSPFGLLCFLTCQIIVFTTCSHFLWMLGEASLFTGTPLAGCLTLVYGMEHFVASLCALLTVLFLRLCWYEPRWRSEVLAVCLRTYSPHFGTVQLYVHVTELPLGLLSLLVAKDRAFLLATQPSMSALKLAFIAYGVAYQALLIGMYHAAGVAVYPFLVRIQGVRPWPAGWVGFGLAIGLVSMGNLSGLDWLFRLVGNS